MTLHKTAIAAFALTATAALAGGNTSQKSAAEDTRQSQAASSFSSQQGNGSSQANGSSSQSLGGDAQVRQAQQALQQQGHDPGSIDGQLGPTTQQALKSFQQSKGLPASGQLDQQTLAALGVQGNGGMSGTLSSSQDTSATPSSSSPGAGASSSQQSSGTKY